MKIVLDLKTEREPNENDVIIFKNGSWSVVTRESFLTPCIKAQAELKKTDEAIKTEIENLKKDFVKLAKIVKEK